jgi:hypothetical protein
VARIHRRQALALGKRLDGQTHIRRLGFDSKSGPTGCNVLPNEDPSLCLYDLTAQLELSPEVASKSLRNTKILRSLSRGNLCHASEPCNILDIGVSSYR